METRQTNPDMNRDDIERPDRAKSDELGRTNTGTRASKPSPREQPAKAVHVDTGDKGTDSMKKSSGEDLDEDEDV